MFIFTYYVLVLLISNILYFCFLLQDRGALRMFSNGKKLKDKEGKLTFDKMPPMLQTVLQDANLMHLIEASYTLISPALISAFVERWHPETNTFHLPIGEMTISLDDVAVLFKLPVEGRLVSLPEKTTEEVEEACMELLCVSRERLRENKRFPMVTFDWLKKLYLEKLAEYDEVDSNAEAEYDDEGSTAESEDAATRAYLLFLVGCTLFADKSGYSTSARYIELFRDLDAVNSYAWGTSALAYLYDHLGYASYASTTQLGGYLSLISVRIF